MVHWTENRRNGFFTLIYETTIPTVENASQTAAWVSEPKFEQKRPGHPAQPPPEWTEAAYPCLGRG
jgi:hypothetical protein